MGLRVLVPFAIVSLLFSGGLCAQDLPFGTKVLGDNCTKNFECQFPLTCIPFTRGDVTVPECRPKSVEGKACNDLQDCDQRLKLRCIAGVCSPPSKIGERCQQYLDDKDCAAGTCINGRCAVRKPAGGSCDVFWNCQDGLTCINGTCSRRSKHGGPCDSSLDCVNSICTFKGNKRVCDSDVGNILGALVAFTFVIVTTGTLQFCAWRPRRRRRSVTAQVFLAKGAACLKRCRLRSYSPRFHDIIRCKIQRDHPAVLPAEEGAPDLDAPAEPIPPETLGLMRRIAYGHISLHDSDSCVTPPELNSTAERVLAHNQPLSPPLVPAQAAVALHWVARRTGDASYAAPGTCLFGALRSGVALCRAVKEEALEPAPLTSPEVPASANVATFLAYARRRGLPDGALFAPDDLLRARDLPRVVRALAALADLLPPAFPALAARVPGARGAWDAADEPDETWAGDAHARALAGAALPARRLGVLVAGAQGAGKSAAAAALLGRVAAPCTPRLCVELADAHYPPAERRRRARTRFVRAANWPARTFADGGAAPADRVEIVRAKVAGVTLSVAELPATCVRFARHDPAFAQTTLLGADFRDIQLALKGVPADVALAVARADLFEQAEFADACANLHRLYGGRVWQRAVLVITHADALPPADSSETDYWVRRTEFAARETLQMFCGAAAAAVPMRAIDSASGTGVDGLAQAAVEILKRGKDAKKLVALPPKKWWEDYVLGILTVYLVNRFGGD